MGNCHITLILLGQFLLPSAWKIVITNVQISKSMMELLSPFNVARPSQAFSVAMK